MSVYVCVCECVCVCAVYLPLHSTSTSHTGVLEKRNGEIVTQHVAGFSSVC